MHVLCTHGLLGQTGTLGQGVTEHILSRFRLTGTGPGHAGTLRERWSR